MTDWQAVVYGVVQGATEWLPISSTAHLRIVPALLGWPDAGAAFTAVIQLGTLLAALVYFRRDIWAIVTGGKSKDAEGVADRRLLVPIVIGTLPIIVFGLAFRHQIEGPLRSLWVIAGSQIVFALLLAVAESYRNRLTARPMEGVTLKDGLMVGLGQAFALIPGASRSGTTITAALFQGLERGTAARFSFLLSLPAVFLAGVKEFWDNRHAISASGETTPIVIATLVAFVVGLASIHWFLRFLRSHSTLVFIGYRLVLGVLLFGLLATHRIAPLSAPAKATVARLPSWQQSLQQLQR